MELSPSCCVETSTCLLSSIYIFDQLQYSEDRTRLVGTWLFERLPCFQMPLLAGQQHSTSLLTSLILYYFITLINKSFLTVLRSHMHVKPFFISCVLYSTWSKNFIRMPRTQKCPILVDVKWGTNEYVNSLLGQCLLLYEPNLLLISSGLFINGRPWGNYLLLWHKKKRYGNLSKWNWNCLNSKGSWQLAPKQIWLEFVSYPSQLPINIGMSHHSISKCDSKRTSSLM